MDTQAQTVNVTSNGEEVGFAKKISTNYVLAVGLTLLFLTIVAPYRNVNIHQYVMAAAMAPFIVAVIWLATEDFTKLLLIFIVYAPFQRVLPGTFGQLLRAFNMTNVMFIFILFGWFYRASMLNERIYRFRKFDLLLAVFLFLSCISLIRGEIYAGRGELSEVVFPLKRWLLPMVMYFIFVNAIHTRDEIKLFVITVCITTSLIGLWGLKEFYIDKDGFGRTFANIQKARIGLISQQPNELGAFFCYYSFFTLSFALSYIKEKWAWFLFIPFLVTMRSMMLTFSRGAKVAFFSSIFVLLFLWNRKVFLVFILPLIVFLAIYPNFIPRILLGRLTGTFDATFTGDTLSPDNPTAQLADDLGLDKSSRLRLEVWYHGLRVLADHPLIGVGFGQFHNAVQKKGKYAYGPQPHNTYLAISTEMGLVALVVFLALIGAILLNALYVYRHATNQFDRAVCIGFLAGLWGLLLSNMFGFRLNSNEIVFYFWLLTAVMVRIREFTEKEVLEQIRAAEEARKKHLIPPEKRPLTDKP